MTVQDMDTSEELPAFPTIRILQLVKDAQQQHGLRHGDYFRYRTYCASKLSRLRRRLKFTNNHKCQRRHKAKFTKKWLSDETFTDSQLVQLSIFDAERSWAQAMFDKMAMEDNPDKARKKYSMRMNLARAFRHSSFLETLIRNSSRCDASTKLEAQAYASWFMGIWAFECKEWTKASEALKTTRTVYEGLAETTHNTTIANLYKAKCREIQPQLRLCEFNSAETPSIASVGELMEIRLQIGGGESVDKLIAEARAKASNDDVVVVEWAGEKATVEDDKARQVVLGWRQAEKELSECQSPKEKMALYEKQLADTRDAIDRMSDLIRRRAAENKDSSVLQNIKVYLEFLKMTGTSARYRAMIENYKAESEKKVKPQDLLRLYDSVIEIYKEVLELPGAESNKDLLKAFEAKVEYYKAFRCHFMAAAYAYQGKFGEGAALFDRAEERVKQAAAQLSAVKGNTFVTEKKEELEALGKEICLARTSARAKRLAAAAGGADASQAATIDDRPLCETLDEWRSWNIEQSIKTKKAVPVVRFPPAFIPMPNKPVFFDLALNHLKMPDLDERLAKCAETTTRADGKKQGGGKLGGGKQGGGKGGDERKRTGDKAQEGQAGWGGWFWGKK